MSHTLCIETICAENRTLQNLEYHAERLNRTRRELWGYTDQWNLGELIEIPDSVDNQVYKCRLSYEKKIQEIRWEPYTFRQIARVQRVYHDTIDYTYKYDQRDMLNALFAQRQNADEILIIKNGFVTDSFYCNVALFDGNQWFTPTTYLLPGTQRAHLLQNGTITETEIKETDLNRYTHIKLFNAMISWNRAPTLPITTIQ